MFEFFIDNTTGDFIDEQDPRRGVIGRSGDGKIRLDQKFTLARRYEVRNYPNDYDKPLKVKREWPVSLVVTNIQAYGKHLDWIGDGLTGYIGLEGTGDVRSGDVLVKE